MSQEWATQLDGLLADDTVLVFDRLTGAPTLTLLELRNEPVGSVEETLHFVLNNVVVKDNRIPPWGMDPEQARKRNVLPVPASQYGGGLSGSYNYWDEVQLNPPLEADHAEIDLKYQPTSWEYIQFLDLANDGSKAFLQDQGKNMLEAWIHTGMAEPHVMVSSIWTAPPSVDCNGDGINVDLDGFIFDGITVCETSNSIVAPNVTIKPSARITFRSPSVSFGASSSVEAGGVLSIQTYP